MLDSRLRGNGGKKEAETVFTQPVSREWRSVPCQRVVFRATLDFRSFYADWKAGISWQTPRSQEEEGFRLSPE